MAFQPKTEDLLRLGMNSQPSMLQMMPQAPQNFNNFFINQGISQPLLNTVGQDMSSIFTGSNLINLNQVNIPLNQQIHQTQQIVGSIQNQNNDTNSLHQQLLLQQAQAQQMPLQTSNMNNLLLLLQLQQQTQPFQNPQQQVQNSQQQQLIQQQQQQQQQQLLLNQQLQLAQLQQRQQNNQGLFHNLNFNNQSANGLKFIPIGASNTQIGQYAQVKEEELDFKNNESEEIDEEEDDDEEEQITAQQSPNKFMPNQFMVDGNHKIDFGMDAEARARAATAPSFNPLNDYKMVMMQTPLSNNKRENQNIFTPLNSQLATQQLIQANVGAIQATPGAKLPEFQLNQFQPANNQMNGLFQQIMKIKTNQNTATNNNNLFNINSMNLNPNYLTKEQVNDLKRQLGITVRDRETLAPFLEQWNSMQETEQVIATSYSILKSFPFEKTAAYENQFKVEYMEQNQKCNYVNKFINSKGLIVKDEKLGKIKIENKISRFHNLSRLLMYTILTAFNKNNLSLMNLDEKKAEAIIKTIQRLKQSARKKTPKGLVKTDFFNHTHYNVLFLTINEQNIEQVRKNAKDVSTHMKVFNVNLEKPYEEISEEIRYSNIIKKLAYHIMLASYKKSKDDKHDQDSSNSSNSTFREQYIDRAMLGIGKLNQGVLIQRF
ncbi:competence pheromone ComX protein, putative (macronuclear) [Tetrahymena thermophila SB210]|uniref:Competence pheromone ComX protein, putative n=1 Tax=Tetrahymena thermophila (strain SB210) TaxID=312017 RepID=I7M1I4_TETTS|nr:competence pheromone ComX protein, putative [Tetrahymena thermophila SB210]EAR96404.1 competence pheromone ComX protein, putative [Tetrahymena thermophila SB210]|eukprot:XP_001016649.1 competence pheromone ComX protein, putative [Tetrahymena thermophila SB210]